MNRLTFVVFVICACLVATTGQTTKEKKSASGGEEQIKALLDQSREAALKGDSSYIEKNVADDYTRTNFSGTTESKSNLINAYKSGDLKYQSIETSDVKVQIYGDAAVATYAAQVKATNKGQDTSGSFRVTRVFVKRNGKWQEVAFQSTRVS